MSCYTRHLTELLPADPRPEDKRALDAAVRDLLGMGGDDCPQVWEGVEARRKSDPEFGEAVRSRIGRGSH